MSNIAINKYFNYERRFDGVFLRDNLSRKKEGEYFINLDDKQIKETHWLSVLIDRNAAVYFASFQLEDAPKDVLNTIKDKSTHPDYSIMYDFIVTLSLNI